MKKRWEKIVAILGISAMLVSQSFCTYAAELDSQTENVESQFEELDEELDDEEAVEELDESEATDEANESDEEELEEVAETADAESDTEVDETIAVLSEEAPEETVVRDGTATDLELYQQSGSNSCYLGFTFNHNLAERSDGKYEGNYRMHIYADGKEVNYISEKFVTKFKYYSNGMGSIIFGDKSYDFKQHKTISTLKFSDGQVITYSLENLDTGAMSEMSNGWTYQMPEEYDIPQNFHVNYDDGKMVLEWDPVENTDTYCILFRRESDGKRCGEIIENGITYFSITDYEGDLLGEGTWTAVINSVSSKGWGATLYGNPSDFSDEITFVIGGTENTDDEYDNGGSEESDSDSSSGGSSSVVVIDDEQVAGAASVSDATSKKGAQPIIGTSIGWDSLDYELAKSIELAGADTQALLYINLNGTDIIPASAISKVAGKNVLLNIIVDSNIVVNIDALSLNALEDTTDITFATAKNTDGTYAFNVRSQNVNLDKNIAVFYNAGITNVAGTSNLNFVNADQSLVEFRNSTVYENGFAAFVTPLVNANYILTIN
jgi:hypothetical protein